MLRVCMSSIHFPPDQFHGGGVGVHVRELTKRLATKIELHVLTPRASGLPEEEFADNIYVHRIKPLNYGTLGIMSFAELPFSKELSKAVNSIKPDIVHIQEPHFALFSFNRPTITTAHGTFVGEAKHGPLITKLSWGYPRAILRGMVYHRVNKIIAVSGYTREEINKYYGVPTSKIEVIYNGIDLTEFNPTTDGSSLRSKFEDCNKLVLFVGPLKKRKGIHVILKSAELLPEVKFIIVGPRHRWKNYEQDEKRLKNVFFTGRISREDLIKYYAAADVCAFPSLYEGFGITICEAMAMQKPIVTSNCSAIPEVLGNAGLFCEPNNPKDVALKITELLNDNDLASKLAKRARRKAMRYDWKNIVDETLSLYEMVYEEWGKH